MSGGGELRTSQVAEVAPVPRPAAPSIGSGTAWVLRPRPGPDFRLRLFCFPYAGGSASSYRGWSEALASGVEVCPIQLPGRGSRFREAPLHRVGELVPALADGLQPLLDRPFAFFGHSMGALVAFELARELRRRSAPAPLLLAASGHLAPHRPDPDPPFAHLPDPEFLREVCARYDGIPPEILAERELLELMLPVLRADILALETHAYTSGTPLDCPLSCFGGEDDPRVSRADLEAWRDQTHATFRVRTFPGRHFFIDSARGAVLQALREDLRAAATLRGVFL